MEEDTALKTIRALRRERGWTQFELALMVGVQPQAIYLWETGRRTPQVPQLRKLGKIFGMCSDDIVLIQAFETGRTGHGPDDERRLEESVPHRERNELATAHGNRAETSGRGNE
jgi:DNA-binding XRE family transcriptional regulator